MKFFKTATLIKFIIPVLIIYALFMMAEAGEKRMEARQLLESLRQQAESIRRENEDMERQIDSADSDEVIASVARERYGLVMPDEKVFYGPLD